MGTQKESNFNPWLIVLGCVGCSAMLITILCNTAGMFLTPVMEEFGWSRTQASLYLTIYSWIAAALQPVIGKIYEKYDIRWIMSGIVVMFGAAYLWSSTFTQLWQWNLFGVLYGVAAGFFMYLPQPILINRWFKKKTAFALSVVGCITGVTGYFVNPQIQKMITSIGWQAARFRVGLITVIGCLILCVLFVRSFPEKMGAKPYGADDAPAEKDTKAAAPAAAAEGLTRSQAVKTPAFYMVLVVAFISCLCPSLNQQLPSYSATVPIGAAAGAMALSILSIAGLPRGPIVGWLCDKIGSITTNIICCLLAAGGLAAILLTGGTSTGIFYLGVGLFSLSFVPLTIGNPMITREAFGTKDYSNIYSLVTTTVMVAAGLSPMIYAQIYDRTGSYAGCIGMVIVLLLIQAVLLPVVKASSKGSKAA